MFTGMDDKDELARQRMNDWMAGPGATVAVVITAIMMVGLIWSIVAGFLR